MSLEAASSLKLTTPSIAAFISGESSTRTLQDFHSASKTSPTIFSRATSRTSAMLRGHVPSTRLRRRASLCASRSRRPTRKQSRASSSSACPSPSSTLAASARTQRSTPRSPRFNRCAPTRRAGRGNSLVQSATASITASTARRRFRLTERGAGGSLRAAYTLSRLIDDGVVNTSSALRVGDFRAERARSLLDRRHRFVLAATLDAPRALGRLKLASVLRLASGAPFNISLGGTDRNLDDVSNDRPSFAGDPRLIRWRRPGELLDPRLLEAFKLPLIGGTGDLPRNARRGPALFAFDLNVEREFRVGERTRLRPTIEVDNLLNKTAYTFGAEFINFNALRPNATEEQRRAFAETFLTPTRTLRPRSLRVGLRVDF